MLSLFPTRKIILNILLINLSAKIHEFPLDCISRKTGYIALAMEFTKPQIISEHLKAQFKRRTFHVPNLIPLIRYMKRSTFESIKFNMCNLGRPKN